jgi:dipeptidyl-peptidase-4
VYTWFAALCGFADELMKYSFTMKLTLAVLSAGKPYDLLLLPGTHMLADDLLRARETGKQMDFLAASGSRRKEFVLGAR